MLKQTGDRKLIILDPSLKDMGGHFYEYDAALSLAALRRAMPTSIYAHKSGTSGLAVPGVKIHPWFSTEWTATGGRARIAALFLLGKLPVAWRAPLARLARFFRRLVKRYCNPVTAERATISAAAKLFEQEVAEAVRHANCCRGDIIFVPTIRTSELFALWNAVQNAPNIQGLQFHIVLRRDAAEMNLPEDGAPGISHLFQEMQKSPVEKTFRFYCDTEQLCIDYKALTPCPVEFHLLPIPFPNPDCDPITFEDWSAGPALKLVYLGGARVEKGFHLLPRAVPILQEAYPEELSWRLQAPISSALEEPEVVAARRQIESLQGGGIELIERHLTSAEFQSLLMSADLVLLPYLAEFYRARSSGILVQVLAAGKPAVIPALSWLSSQTNGLGAIEFGTAADFPHAVLQAIKELPRLRREATERAANYAAFHNADGLLTMLEKGTDAPDCS